uniref:HD domain-containing protein n=1 Tax=Neolamprologus brichardi TaxID=32507 RepID=A0A3Q4M9M9_NEOBR
MTDEGLYMRLIFVFFQVFYDPIHGLLELHPLLYSRGVAYLAGQFAEALSTKQPKLNITPEDILCVQIAGLCHDLGQGPFSIVFEEMFILEKRADLLDGSRKEISVKMFDYLLSTSLRSSMEEYGLNVDGQIENDLVFIKEMIRGHLNTDETQKQFMGRTKDKYFFYEIVGNEKNGIDVDKFDYIARDSYYLGIQSSFDHRRCLMFARVCRVGEKNRICFRDEVSNLYSMFQIRSLLHRTAYQHKTTRIIEVMIKDALLQAGECIQIEGSEEKIYSLSTAIEDMEAYIKLTAINSSSKEMGEAKKLLSNIVSRQIYKCLGKMQSEKPTMVYSNLLFLSFFTLSDCGNINHFAMDYGIKEKEIIENVFFYKKNQPGKPFKLREDEVSMLLPKCSSEQFIRVYYKNIDEEVIETAQKQKVGTLLCGMKCQTLRRKNDGLGLFVGYRWLLQMASVMHLVGQGFIVQQDNDPKHKSRLLQIYLRKKEQEGKLDNMEWPAQSPDLNHIKLVWNELDRRVKAKQPRRATHLCNS